MGRSLTYINMLPVMFVMAANTAPAMAQPAPFNLSGTYDFTIGAIPFGMMNFSFDQQAGSYDATANVHTTGLARVFVQHDSTTTSKGTGANYNYPNSVYESNYQTRKKKKYVKMVRANGEVTSETITPPDDRKVRPAVDAALKNAAYNPLAYGLQLRTEMAKCLETKCSSFSYNFFDGRRLTEGTFTPQGTKVLRINGQKYPAYVVTAKRKPIAGFTASELKDISPNEPSLTIYFSQDERLVPMKLDFPMAFGTASATLRQ